MKKIYKIFILSSLIFMIMIVSIILTPTSILANVPLQQTPFHAFLANNRIVQFYSHDSGNSLTPYINPESSMKITWDHDPGYGYGTPIIMTTNSTNQTMYLYCIEPYEPWPMGESYTEAGWDNPAVKALLYHGFPADESGLQKKHGKSNEQAYVATFVALNAYLGEFNRFTVEEAGDGYVNDLLKEADKGYTSLKLSMNQYESSSIYNSQAHRLESQEFYRLSTNKDNIIPFTLKNVPDSVYAIDTTGHKINHINSGQDFKLATDDLMLNTSFKVDVNHDFKEPALYRFTAQNLQTLIGFSGDDPLIDLNFQQTFTAAAGHLTIRKIDKVTQESVVARFKVYDEANKFIGEYETDALTGTVEIAMLPLGTYRIEETWVEEPYVLDTNTSQVIEILEAQQDIMVEFANNKAVGEITIHKVDAKNGAALAGVEYELYASKDLELVNTEQSHDMLDQAILLETATTDEQGRLVFPQLDISRQYAIVERTAPYGYEVSDTIPTVEFTYADMDTPVLKQSLTLMNPRSRVRIAATKRDLDTKALITTEDFILELQDDTGQQIPPTRFSEGTYTWEVEALGLYTVSETQAPQGYQQSEEIITIDTVHESKDNLYTIDYYNQKLPNSRLPKTGALSYSPVVMIGMVLVGIGYIIIFFKKIKDI